MSDPTVFGLLSDKGWILERLAKDIAEFYPKFSYGTELPDVKPDIVYYITYSSRKRPFDGIEMACFTHIEEGLPAEQLFYDVADTVDACITQSDMYRDILVKRGVENVRTINCGIDHTEFKPRLQVGIVGRTYHTGRKGEAMMAELMDMEHVEFHFTGDGWPGTPLHVEPGKMGAFYRSMDYILVPSLYEGGPMCVPEAIASGVPVIAPDIGWVSEFPHIPYEKGNAESLRAVLDTLVQQKLDLAQSAAAFTWERWAQGHADAFRETWERLGPKTAPTKPGRKTISDCSVAQVLHGNEKTSKGGPSVRVPYTAEMMSTAAASSVVSYGAPKKGGLDIAHLYNVWQPDTSLAAMRALKGKADKRVFSPILLDLNLRKFWHETLPEVLKSHESGPNCFVNSLPELQHKYAQSKSKRNAALKGYQPVPGFADKLRVLTHEADHLVFLSDYEKELLEAYCGPVEHATTLRNPVDAEFFRPDRKSTSKLGERLKSEFFITARTPFMLSVGRIEARKNQLMMAALAHDLKIPLVIAGHVGDRAYAKLVQDAGGEYVHLLGRIEPHSEDLLWLYQNCALFLSLSWAEGASLSILEAASTGAPLLLTELSSEREYFEGIASFTPPLDLETAATAARYEMKKSNVKKRKKQHKYVKEKYDWPVHIASLIRIYEDLL